MNLLISPIILIIGTRPEGIKLAPVYFALKKMGFPVKICATFQHTNLLQEVFDLFKLVPDFSFDIMQVDQDLFHITQAVLSACKQLFIAQNPQLVIIQGDTTSGMAAALAAFYLKIPVAHIEAGLRTGNVYAPFPEELNRQFISLIAKYNFAPTANALLNLKNAGVAAQNIYQVGNTVVDSLLLVINKIEAGELQIRSQIIALVQQIKQKQKQIVLLTMHRRESFGDKMERVLGAIKSFADSHKDVCFIYPVHPNPNIRQAIDHVGLDLNANIFLIPSLPYHELIYLLNQANCVATDSGGLQEEAASLGKQVVLLRNETDRPEAVACGLTYLAGYDQDLIHKYLIKALNLSNLLAPAKLTGLYGDGYSAYKIVEILKQEIKMVKVAVVGLGYIGLPTSILLVESGFDVCGYDVDSEKITKIKQGVPVIEEHELGARLAGVIKSKNFHVDTTLVSADYYIIAVPTPVTDDKKADLSYVWQAVTQIARVIKAGSCVIIESTVPVGTTKQIAKYLSAWTGLVLGQNLFVAFSPERVIPGKIFQELVHNDRLIGGVDEQSGKLAANFYANFVKGDISQTNADTAEMVKLVENSSRDVQIAFANQVASMAQVAGVNPLEVIAHANKHPRVNILTPGCGVGGHCIAVDPWFLVESFPAQTALLQAARKVNDSKPQEVLCQIKQEIKNIIALTGKIKVELCVLGITYKPDTDDLRNSPALWIAQELQKLPDINLTVIEPNVDLIILNKYFKLAVTDPKHVLVKPDLTVALVAHTKFKQIFKDSFVSKDMLDFCAMQDVTAIT